MTGDQWLVTSDLNTIFGRCTIYDLRRSRYYTPNPEP